MDISINTLSNEVLNGGAILGSDCELFTGGEGGLAILTRLETPGRSDKHAVIVINSAAADKLASITTQTLNECSYEENPFKFERCARLAVLDAVPEMVSAIMLAKSMDATIIEVRGLPTPSNAVQSPYDGTVVEEHVRQHVFNLVGSFVSALSLQGFAYASENDGRLLRAISPVPQLSDQASSQGYSNDLGWHQDNANRTMTMTSGNKDASRGPMNDYQAFVCVNPDKDVPMEIVSLTDIVSEVSRKYGSLLVDVLHQPKFGICRPDSHGGGLDVEGVQLLHRDTTGRLFGRFHADNVMGLTDEAQEAYRVFKSVCAECQKSVEIEGESGSLLIYANTRVMHRRREFCPKLNGKDRYYVRLYMMAAEQMRLWGNSDHHRVFP